MERFDTNSKTASVNSLGKVSRAIQHEHLSLSRAEGFSFPNLERKEKQKNRAEQSRVRCLPPVVLTKWCGPSCSEGRESFQLPGNSKRGQGDVVEDTCAMRFPIVACFNYALCCIF